MNLCTYFKPGEMVFLINYYEGAEPVYTKVKCSVCNGNGVIEETFGCSKCGGSGVVKVITHKPKTNFTCFEEMVQVVRSKYSGKNKYEEWIYRRFIDEALHNSHDSIHKGYGIKTHSGHHDFIFRNKGDFTKLQNGVAVKKNRVFRVRSKFVIGMGCFGVRCINKLDEKCMSCGGQGSLIKCGLEHHCITCHGAGEVPKDVKIYDAFFGVIQSVTLLLIDDETNVSYDILTGNCRRSFSEGDVFLTRDEFVVEMVNRGYENRMIEGHLNI